MDNKALSVREASIQIGITEQGVRKALKDGRLKGRKLNKRSWIIMSNDVVDFMTAR